MRTTAGKRLPIIVVVLVTLVTGLAAGFWMPDDEFFALRKNFQIFSAVYEELIGGYVDPLDAERLMRSGIDAMLADLDPYTTFIDEADNADIDIITRGQYGGVGLNLDVRDGSIIVLSPIEGTSGYKQGVRTGDVITEIEGRSSDDLSLSDIRGLLRGEPGTVVELTIEREGEPQPLHFVLTRERERLKNVAHDGYVDLASGIGYIKLDRFARGAEDEVRSALQDLRESGSLNGLIIDLRDNPGGLLDAAVAISQIFVPQGSVIVSTRGRRPETERVYRSKLPPVAPDLPLAVLVNDLTASASEIVAGAFQDLDRAVIVGTTSFGKGLVQIIKPLPYNTSLKLTTSKYYTPSGRSIQSIDYGRHDGRQTAVPDSLQRTHHTANGREVRNGSGIRPDVVVSPGEESDLEAALTRRAGFFFYANHFSAQNDSIQREFVVTDEVMADFRTWLEEEDFTYRTNAERVVDALADDLTESGYTSTGDELAALREAVRAEKQADFVRLDAELKERLRAEILTRYFGTSGQIEASFDHDQQILAAASLLKDRSEYDSILTSR
ncbi:MAG: S41 family peptidase [Rhodothermales bacterium]